MSIVAFVFSVLAIMISAMSVWYTKRTYEKSLEPILKSSFIIDHRAKKCALRLLNDGPNNLHAIEIRKTCFLFAANGKLVSKLAMSSSSPPWSKLDLLKAGKEQMLPISEDEVRNVFRNAGIWKEAKEEQKPVIGIMKFSITFRRKPDKKEFHVVSRLFVVKESNTGELDPQDRDTLPPFIRDLEKETVED